MGRYFFSSLVLIGACRLAAAFSAVVAFVERIFAFAFPLEPLRIQSETGTPPAAIGRIETSAFISRRIARDQRRLGAACTYAAA